MKRAYEIIHEDDALVIVNKAAGVLTIPDRYHPEKFNLFTQLNKQYGRVFVVHRLDKETSGILVFARTEQAHKNLSQQFENRTVRKAYFAIVEGELPQGEGKIDKPLAPHQHHPERMVISANGKPSLTTYKVLDRFRSYTAVEAEIHTGRTHQIRVHFQSIGHPLAVDAVYGKRNELFLSEFKRKNFTLGKGKEERPLIRRSTLHAQRLSFVHPQSGKTVEFEAPLPKDLRATLNQLRKWAT
ncbi:MAG: RNA pseudouridine synthase [Saprospirales bacterium]|nr:RNA pseudouridine synthase [Saprospirales bacterium]